MESTDRRKKTASILNRHQLSRFERQGNAQNRLRIALRESGVTSAHRSSKEVGHGSGEAARGEAARGEAACGEAAEGLGGLCTQCPAWGTVAGSAAPPWRCGLIGPGRRAGPSRGASKTGPG